MDIVYRYTLHILNMLLHNVCIYTGAYTGFFPGGGKIQQNITLCARSAHKVKLARAKRARFFLPPPGTFLPPPQSESRVIFPRHFHSKHICTLSLQSKEKHTFCPTKKQKNIFNKFVLCEERL